jgi:phosphocarrier protein HPr
MYSDKFVVINKTGLHARPASEFVSTAKRFACDITVHRTEDGVEEAVNAKSIVLLLSLGVCEGDEIEIVAAGAEERQAVKALVDLLATGFGEI